jgi:hypothetical protein
MTPKFFLKLEDSPQHGGKRVTIASHIPRVLTIDEARQLATELLSLTDPNPAPAAKE